MRAPFRTRAIQILDVIRAKASALMREIHSLSCFRAWSGCSFCDAGRKKMYIYTYMHSYIHTYIHTHLVTVWAAQFFLVRVPLVATLLHSSMISSHHFSVHRLWRLSFLLFRHRQWRPLSLHFIAAFLCAPPVATQLSVLGQNAL